MVRSFTCLALVLAVLVAPSASAAPAPVVAAVGDIACPASAPVTAIECRQWQVADAIATADPDSVWILGDIQYPNAALADFQSSFDKSFGRFRQIWRPSPGNHEYDTPGASGYFDYFGAAAGARDRGYYSFNVGRWHVVSLNSNCKIVACDAKSAQAEWLKQDLAKNGRECTAAIYHHPLYSSGAEHGSDPVARPLWRILQSRKAEIVVNGHEHDFEAFKRQDENGKADRKGGLQQFVVGTGGKSAYPFAAILPNTLARQTGDFGFLKLRLMPRKYSWRFIDENGAVLHRGVGNCR